MKLVPDITNYDLEFVTKKFKTADPIWRSEIIDLHEIRYPEVFAVADAKTKVTKIPLNSDLVLYFYGNVTSCFFIEFNVKLVIQFLK